MKVEIEVYDFEGWEFVAHKNVRQIDYSSGHYIYDNTQGGLRKISADDFGISFFVYRPKKTRQIILEEVAFDIPKAGDIYLDMHGQIFQFDNQFDFPIATKKRTILKIVNNDFN